MELLSDWNHIDKLLPTPDHPILVAKLTDNNSMFTQVGRLVLLAESGDPAWLCTEDNNILRLEARPYWLDLIEKNLEVPSNFTDVQLQVVLTDFLKRLSFFETKFQVLATAMMQSGKGLYPVD